MASGCVVLVARRVCVCVRVWERGGVADMALGQKKSAVGVATGSGVCRAHVQLGIGVSLHLCLTCLENISTARGAAICV